MRLARPFFDAKMPAATLIEAKGGMVNEGKRA